MGPGGGADDGPAIPRPVDLAPARPPVAGGVTALVTGMVHLLIGALLLGGGLLQDAHETATAGAVYTAVAGGTCALAGLTLRGRRWAAITLGVIHALGAALLSLGLLGFAIGDEEREPVLVAVVAGVMLGSLVPSILCFRDARRLRLAHAATIDNLRTAFQ